MRRILSGLIPFKYPSHHAGGRCVVRMKDNESDIGVGLLHEMTITGRKVGADRAFYAELAQNEKLFEQVVQLVISKDCTPTTSQERACEIMGKNFFGIREAVKRFRVNPTQEQLNALAKIPFSEEVLEQAKDTHVLVAVFPLSIIKIRVKARELFCLKEIAWWDDESFAKERGEVGWHLVRKTPIDKSTSRNWQEQQATLPKNDEVPTARVMVYTIIGHCLATGERLFKSGCVRTSSVDSGGYSIHVGNFGSLGLCIYCHWGNYCSYDDLSVASAIVP